MLGGMPQLTGNDKGDLINLYDYVIALRRELDDMLYHLDSDNIREINAERVNVYNLNASKIKTGTLDAGIIDVINLNAGNIVTGTLSADHIATDISQVNSVLRLGGWYQDLSSIAFSGNGGIDAQNGILEFSALTNMDFLTNVSFEMNVNFYYTADFSSASVDGLQYSGWASRQWVTDNFVAKE